MTYDLWFILGLVAQLLFSARILIQWIASERAGRSVVPVAFWYFSLLGSLLLLVYSFIRHDLVFVFSQLPGLYIYVRNLQLIKNPGKREHRKRDLLFATVALSTVFILAMTKLGKEIPVMWLVIGLTGQVIWNGRFVVQLICSEREGHSYLPKSFWILGLVGSAITLIYAFYRREPVFILGQLPNVFVYARNLLLISRSERSETGA